MERHNEDVKIIAANVRQFYDRKEGFRIYHGWTNSTRAVTFKKDEIIDTSGLSHVLKIDKKTMTALVEPNVPMDRLVEATLEHGLVPPVVTEFPSITVGGGFAGTAAESSSFRHGFFDRIVNWIEMVLASGDIVTASEIENPDLFHGAAGTLGTLGVTTLLEIQLIEAKPYVELTYYPISSVSGALRRIEKATEDSSVQYLDGILFAIDRGFIMTGRMVDTVPVNTRIQRFSRAVDPWFFIHVKRILAKTNFLSAEPTPVTIEAIPLDDYLFRYDRGAVWTGAYAFKSFLTPFNRITRYVLDKFMHTKVMYHALHKSGFAKHYFVQDLALPYSTAPEFLEYVDHNLNIYPIWLCPLLVSPEVPLHPHAYSDPQSKETILLNVGVWGLGPTNPEAFIAANRKMEKKLQNLRGFKWFYARAYYSEDEFYEIYDQKWYDGLRKKYHATYLPTVYDKVKDDPAKEKRKREIQSQSLVLWLLLLLWEVWPFSGLWGVYCAYMGGDYLLEK